MRQALAQLSVVISTRGDVGAAAEATLRALEMKRFEVARGQMAIRVRFSPDMPRGHVLTDGTGNILAAESNLQLLLAGPAFDRVERIGRLPRGCWPVEPLLMPEVESAFLIA